MLCVGALAFWIGLDWAKTLMTAIGLWFTFYLVLRDLRLFQSKKEEDLALWFAISGTLYLVLDWTFTIKETGGGFADIGWDPCVLNGKKIASLLHPDDHELFAQTIKNSIDVTPPFTARWRRPTNLPNGEAQWVWFEWVAIRHPRENLFYAQAKDMTARFHHEAQVATWARITTDLMGVSDLNVPIEERRFEWVNEAWARELGWDLYALYQTPILHLIEPRDVITMVQFRQEADSSRHESVINCRLKSMLPGAQSRLYEWRSINLNGKVYVNGRDIETIRNHQEEIERVIADLQTRNADLEKFATIAAHQLRSPPRTIVGLTDALREDYGERLPESALSYLEDIRKDADYMAEIVDGLFRFSRVRAGGDIHLSPVDLNELMSEVHRRSFDLQPHLTWEKLPVVLGDKLLLQEVLSNLIQNGFKYNESIPKTVHVSARHTGQKWCISVEDNGIGIPSEYHKKLFVMFERVHPQYTGTGVGLALVAAIVEKLGGRVLVESSVGEGSVFSFELNTAWFDEV